MIKKLLLIIIFATSWSGFALAETKESESTESQTQVKTSAKKDTKRVVKTKNRLGVDQSDFMPSEQQFGFIVSYSAGYDQLQQEEAKSITHNISIAGTYSFNQKFSSYAAVALSHESQGEKIVRENDTDQYHGLSNFNLGLVYTFSPNIAFINRSSNTLNISLPLSERSQIDEQIMSASLVNFMTTKSWMKLSLFNRLNTNYLWNTQKFSIFDNTLNRDWLLSETFGVNYQVLQSVGLRASLQVSQVRYLDSTWDLNFGNQFAVFSNLYGFQLFAAYSNFSYPENDRLDIGFYDKYKRFFSMGVTYAF